MKKFLLYLGYWVLSLTWGIIMTIIGLFAAFGLLISGHKPKVLGPNVYFVVGKYWGGVNLGPVFITCSASENTTKYHEAGHGLQNILYGPLFPFIVAIPSFIRYWYFNWCWKHNKETKPYDSIWFEGQATKWGTATYRKENN